MTPPAKNSVEIRLELGWDDEQFEAELDAIDAITALIDAKKYEEARDLRAKYVADGVMLE
jgi:hypothetical protein